MQRSRPNVPEEIVYRDKVTVRVNLKLISILLAVVVATVVGGFFTRRFFLRRNADSLFQIAQRQHAAGETAAALKYIGTYLRMRPGDDDARLVLIDWLDETPLNRNRQLNAYQILADYVSHRPTDREARLKLLRRAMSLERYDNVLNEHLGPLKEEVGKDLELTQLVATCHLRRSEWLEALRCFADALEIDSSKPENYLGLLGITANPNVATEDLAVVLKRFAPPTTSDPAPTLEGGAKSEASGEPDEAAEPDVDDDRGQETDIREELFRAIFARMERDVRPPWAFLVARIEHLSRQGELAESARLVADALERHPTVPEVLLAGIRAARARHQSAQRMEDSQGAREALEEGLSLADRGLKLDSPRLEFFEARARLVQEKQDYKTSHDIYREGLDLVESRIEKGEMPEGDASRAWLFVFQWGVANALLNASYDGPAGERGQINRELDEILKEMRRISVRKELIEFLEARQQMSSAHWSEAASRLEELRGNLTDIREAVRSLDLSLLECYGRLENPDAQIGVLNRAITEDPLWQKGRILRASLYANIGMEDEALAEFNRTMTIGEVPVSVMRLLIRQQLKRPAEQRDWSVVEGAIERLEERREDDAGVKTLRAELLFQQSKFSAADEHLKAARQADPKSAPLTEVHLLLTMARTDIPLEQRIEAADQMMSEFETEAGDTIAVRLMKGELAVIQEGRGAATALQRLGEKLEGFADEEAVQVLRGLAELANNAGIEQVAEELWLSALKREPRNVGVLLRLADLAVRRRDVDGLQRYLELVQAVEGADGPNGSFLAGVAALQRAGKLSTGGVAEEGTERNKWVELGISRLKQSIAARPLWSEAHRLLGISYEQLGLVRESQAELLRAFELGDRDEQTTQLIVEHFFREGRYDEVLQIVSRIEKSNATVLPDALKQRAAVSAFRLRMWDDALRQIQDKATSDVSDLLFQAQIRISRGESGPAIEELLAQATAGAPDRPHAWFLRVSYLAEQNRRDDALKVIEEAAQRVSAEPPHLRPLTLGICYEAVNDLARAEKELALAHEGNSESLPAIYEHFNFCLRHGRFTESQKLLSLLLDPNSKLTREQRAQAVRIKAELQAANAQSYAEFDEAMQVLGGGKVLAETSTEDLRAQLNALSRSRIRHDIVRQILIYEVLSSRRNVTLQDRLRIAQLNEEAGRWSTAVALYRELLRDESANPEIAASFLARALPREKISGETGLLRDIELAVAALERLEPESFRTAHAKSQLLGFHNRISDAVAVLDDFLSRLGTLPAEQVFSALLRTGRANYTIASLRRQIDPGDNPAAVEILANVQQLINTGNEPLVRRTLAPILETAAVRSMMQSELIRLVGISLEELGDEAAAEQAINDYIQRSESPDAPLVLASFKARNRDVTSALAIVQAQEGKVSDLAAARFYVSIVRIGGATGEQCDWVAGRLKRLFERAENPRDQNAVAIAIADLHLFQAEYAEASEVYRRILAAEPANVVALNNLAFVTSFDRQLRNESLELVRRAIDLAGPLPDLLDTHGLICINLEQTQQAIEIFQRALDENPSAVLWFHLAIAQEQARLHDDALKSRDQALANGFKLTNLTPIERTGFKAQLRGLGFDAG